MRTLFESLCEQINKGKDSVAAILMQDGAGARKQYGTHMLIDELGLIYGYFYKTYVEHSVELWAQSLFDECRGTMGEFAYSFGGEEEKARVCFCYIEAGKPQNRQMVWRALDLIREGENMWLAVNLHTAEMAVIDAFGVSCGCRIPASVCKARPEHAEIITEDVKYYLEPIHYNGKVYIIGGGNIALELVEMLDKANFRTVIIDDSIEYANRERFPRAYDIQIRAYNKLKCLLIEPEDHVVILTRSFQCDKTVMGQILETPVRSILTVNNEQQKMQGKEWLRKHGYTQEEIQRLTDITLEEYKCETPYEIAMAVTVALIRNRTD